VSALSNDRVTAIANDYLAGAFESAFRTKLGVELPETVNGDHRIVVVGSKIDSSSERIMRYLSDTHGVNINAATFHYFQPADWPELLARVFLLEPSEVELNTRAKGSSKRRPNLSYEELKALAVQAGVPELYEYAVAPSRPCSRSTQREGRSASQAPSAEAGRPSSASSRATATPGKGCATGSTRTGLRS
jgi:hypothetical protein